MFGLRKLTQTRPSAWKASNRSAHFLCFATNGDDEIDQALSKCDKLHSDAEKASRQALKSQELGRMSTRRTKHVQLV